MAIEDERTFLYAVRMSSEAEGGMMARADGAVSGRDAFLRAMQVIGISDAENYLEHELLGDSNGLSDLIGEIRQTQGDKFSRIGITVDCVHVLYAENLEREAARQLMLANEIPLFIVYLDMSIGVRTVANAISMAEKFVAGTLDDYLAMAISETADLRYGYDEQGSGKELQTDAEAFLELRQKAKGYAALLMQDSSGYLLLDSILKEVDESPDPFHTGFSVPDYVSIGARAAVELYKRVYPLTEKPA